jgi:DUF1680 family protein
MNITKGLVTAACFVSLNVPMSFGSEPMKNLKVDTKVKEFELGEVVLLDGPFKEAQNRDIAWLKSLDMERLLAAFRKTAGIPSKAVEYGGWEAADAKFDGIRGHFVGHYLSALAKGYAVTGDKDLKKRIDYMVDELAKCQKASKANYIGAFPESMFDDLNAGKQVSWVPWYTMHKLMAGLYDIYNYSSNANVYQVLMQLTDWGKVKTDPLDDETMQKVLKTEQGGMAEVLANIYAITQKPAHLALAKKFEHRMLLDNMKAGADILTGLHANTQIPKMIGAAREYEVTGDESYRISSSFFWDCVQHRTSVTGGHSVQEHFKEPGVLAKYLNIPEQDETCNAYNMLQLTSHLFDWTGDVKYAEYMERTLINTILASQTPTKYENEPAGMTTYHQSITPGYWKRFCDKENSFWCCTGTGVENHVIYNKYIYAYDKDGLIVNLFVGSQLSWTSKGLILKQESLFPEQESSKFTISADKPLKMKIKIRVPSWAKSGISVKINGRPFAPKAVNGGYAELEKVWVAKDVIEVSFPMSLHQECLPDNSNMVAFLYGPMVLSGQLGNAGLKKEHFFGTDGDQNWKLKVDSIIVPSFSAVGEGLTWIKPDPAKPLTFTTSGKGSPSDVTLIPYYKHFFERYSIYWEIKP